MTIKFLNGQRVYNDQFNAVAYTASNGWVSGAATTESTPPAMSVDVASGQAVVNGLPVVVGAQTLVIGAADPSNPRFDIIAVNSAGTPVVLAGTPAADPKPQDAYDPSLYAIIARVRVNDNVTEIYDADITDLRTPGGGSGGGASATLFSQPQSGCADGDVVRFNGTNFVPAQANSIADSRAVGIINNVSGGTGDVILFGEIDFLSGLTAGELYYLSAATPGALTTSRPPISIKVGVALSTTRLALDIDRTVGGAGNRYTQAFSGTSITVTHNLNDALPVVQVYNDLNEWITPDNVEIIDANTVQLDFTVSTDGTVVVQSLSSFTTDTGTTAYFAQTFSSATNVVVPHNLNQQYVAVQVVDGSNVVIEPQSVTLDNANQLTVTFAVATSGRVIVVGGSTFGSAVGTGDLLPNADNAFDIGSGGARWANGYFGGDVTINGKLTVDGAIDPISLTLNPQVSAPTPETGLIYFDSAASKLQVSNDGVTYTDISVPPDDVTLEVDSGALQIKDGGVTADKLATDVAEWTLLETLNPSAVGSISTGTLPAYRRYKVVATQITPSLNGQQIGVRVNGISSGYDYRYISGTTVSSTTLGIYPFINSATTSGDSINTEVIISGLSSPNANGRIYFSTMPQLDTSGNTMLGGHRNVGASVQVSVINIVALSGTITGRIKIWGSN